MFLFYLLWWLLFIGSFTVSMSFFLSWLSGEKDSKKRILISMVFGSICILTFLVGTTFKYI
jgi:hypothetical protein